MAGTSPSPTSDFDIEAFLRGLTTRPGVYRMLGADGTVLYVGKARNLRNRVTSYFRGRPASAKTHALLAQTATLEVTITRSEAEALLVEYNQIKQFKPRFNVVLRDDKSFPYIRISTGHAFPSLRFYRGSTRADGQFFGPYPSAHAVRETLGLLQKLFQVRQCEDSFFANRSRPCLQHQIKRCSAPCVGAISEQDYRRDIDDAIRFLEGRNREVITSLAARMEAAAAALEYETAARLRDQIATLKRIDEQQLTRRNDADADVIALAGDGSLCCVAVLFIRAGRNLGARAYFPQTATGVEAGEVLGAFISQFYMLRELPGEIITGAAVEDADLLERLLSQKAGRKVAIRHRVRGERARWVRLADTNASHSLQHRLSARSSIREQLEELRDALGLPEVPTRIECFDVSHSHGEATVASCVVFGTEGPLKSEYRRFNIKGRTPGDDYGAMREALSRRYTRLKRGEAALPDLLVLDGGKGQLGEALKVLEELQVNAVETVAIAKGPARRPGSEQLFVRDRGRPIVLAQDSRALHLLQRIRDEAHRFAIGGHRLQRARRRGSSVLEAVPGLGPKRRRELLRQFGGLQGVMRAGVDDLSRVHGISEALARRIYETLHPVS